MAYCLQPLQSYTRALNKEHLIKLVIVLASVALTLATLPLTTKPNVSTSKVVGVEKAQSPKLHTISVNVAQVSPKAETAPKQPENAPDAKSFIYFKESGNRPTAVNASSGACGIGQALPCSKLKNVCPDMDYACQDQFFTKYMQNRYGTWENAKAFWLKNKWW